MPRLKNLPLAILFFVFSAPFARADAIDGNWCGPKGRRISIEGPSGVYAGGFHLKGHYTRHSYSFAIPQGAPEGGAAVDMVLQGETRTSVRIDNGPAEIWQRCASDIS
ncbi:MAG TPA: hypothetical protein PKW21_09785 [Rhabdaerophilum sp.]|nr:hypothetical protein [Rhabdaerophilum sp.]